MGVKLRTKDTNTRICSLYLDIYHDGQRELKFFKIYTVKKPKTEADKIRNAKVKRLADKVRLNTETELTNSNYSKFGTKQTDISFLDYFAKLTKERRSSDGNYANWDSTYKVLSNILGTIPKN